MGNERQYRLVSGNHYHDGERLSRGEVFVPTDKELSAFGYKFEPVEAVESVESESADETDDSETDDSDEDNTDAPVDEDVEPVAAPEAEDEAEDENDDEAEEDNDTDESDEDGELSTAEIDEAFDADDFLHEHWRSVVQMIDAGGVDEHLETVEATERDRSSPRQSVLAALNVRHEELDSSSDANDDADLTAYDDDTEPAPDAAGSLRETETESAPELTDGDGDGNGNGDTNTDVDE